MNFDFIREELLKEAKYSPNLLSDLAGLENYIAQSYNNRSFIELLQNSDDAKSTKFKIVKEEDYILVANNGRIFNNQDLEGICRSASSNKVRGENIGYRGIGFKSVVGFAKEIHIISGQMEVTFSKVKTKEEIQDAVNVPLIRIPHMIDSEIKAKLNQIIESLILESFTTIFIFSGVTAQEIEMEFEMFETSSLLFLKNITETEIFINYREKTKISKFQISESEVLLTINSTNNNSSWLVTNEKTSSIAFCIENESIKKLDSSKCFVYAFLPTENTCGLGVLINGDFSTDPSRKHLIFDSVTQNAINLCGRHILNLINNNISVGGKLEIVNALLPHSDPRMLQFKKSSFDKILLEGYSSDDKSFFKKLKLCPIWLNIKDYSNLYSQIRTINSKCFELEGFIAFAKFLGAEENTFNNFKANINSSEISVLGCVQLTIQVFNGLISGSIKFNDGIANLNLLLINGIRSSFNEIINNNSTIDSSFVSLLIENGLSEFEIKQVLNKYISIDYSKRLFKESHMPYESNLKAESRTSVNNWFGAKAERTYSPTKSSVQRWRSAEENTLEILNANGFKLIDVSKQNIGYDLEGITPDGKEIQIEVKSITMIGQKFKLTNNEVAVAQEKKETYFIAIVRQLDDFLEIDLIPDPITKLTLDRQCVQWIWECSSYDYKPIRFEL
ncbi:MAG: DUF3883 domain-containing protein [Saprospiraceae bacterium]